MAYLVLARKYRPQHFSEVAGQTHVTRTLANAIKKDRVHHAFLFCGPRGVGKTTMARILAKALCCEQGPTPEPCGTCQACVTIGNGNAVDYVEMDGASNRGIDSIRELTEAVRYQPSSLPRKVYVIDEVHMLTTEAFNALLKTLEEPPPHVTFVMATTEPHKLPNTILSRCQRYDFKLVPHRVLVEHLQSIVDKESLDVDPQALDLIARESGGSVRDALSLADQVISFSGEGHLSEQTTANVLGVADRGLTNQLVSSLLGGNAKQALDGLSHAMERGIEEKQIARAIVTMLRDISLLQVSPDIHLVDTSEEERKTLIDHGKVGAHRVRRMFERMLKAADDLAHTTMPHLVLELAILDTAAEEGLMPLSNLVAKLDDIESRLSQPGAKTPSGGSGDPSVSRGQPRQAEEAVPQPPPQQTVSGSAPTPQHRAAPPETQAQSNPPETHSQPNPPGPATKSADNQTASPAGAIEPLAVSVSAQLASWPEVVKALGDKRKLSLYGIYERARVLVFDDKQLVVGFTQDLQSLREMASDRENIVAMQEFLAELVGVKPHIELQQITGEEQGVTLSTVEKAQQDRKQDREQKEKQAKSHPITKAVLETFGGQIEEIRTDVK